MSETTTAPRCAECRFWAQSLTPAHGLCRRRSPSPVDTASVPAIAGGEVFPHAFWPATFHSDWCGEFEARTPPGVPATLAVRRPKGGRT